MDNTDFEEQLALEAQERAKAEQQNQDPYTYVDPNDGTVYEWDHQRRAWFPKVSDDFIASYQATYGNFEDTETTSTKVQEPEVKKLSDQPQKQSLKPGEKRKPQEPAWFDVDDSNNTKVYVSGLPLDITEEEYAELMGKCGLVMKDPATNKLKLKLYKDANGAVKGDGLCCYIKIESVDLALKILDGYQLRNQEIHVERAKFQLKGEYDPSKKPRKKKAKEKEKLKRKMEKLFDWRPDKLRGERGRNEKTVIIKNMFDRKEFENDPRVILEYQQDIRDECKKCGEVKKVVVYDRHPDGVASVTFKEAEEADECINLMNRRWFAGRQLTAETWDGKTRYKIEETEAELEKRISQWDKFLDEDGGNASSVLETEKSQGNEKMSSHVDHGSAADKSSESSELKTQDSCAEESSSESQKLVSDNECLKTDMECEQDTNEKQLNNIEKDDDVGACLTDEDRHSDQDSAGSDTEEKRWP